MDSGLTLRARNDAMTDTGPLFASSGDLIADRRYRWALDLAARGELAGAADVLKQTVALAPTFAAAWAALGALRDQLGDRSGAIALSKRRATSIRRTFTARGSNSPGSGPATPRPA